MGGEVDWLGEEGGWKHIQVVMERTLDANVWNSYILKTNETKTI